MKNDNTPMARSASESNKPWNGSNWKGSLLSYSKYPCAASAKKQCEIVFERGNFHSSIKSFQKNRKR